MKNYIKEYIKKNKFGLILACMVFLLIIPYYINARIKLADIEKNGRIGIAKFIEYKKFPKSREYFFEYFNGNKRIKTSVSNAPDGFFLKEGLFFKIKYLNKFEDLIIVNFNKEITDSSLIIEEGFSIEDLNN
jgi:hypothetical protein